jgi:threonine/homoserine/homoserine lactone efflux protein
MGPCKPQTIMAAMLAGLAAFLPVAAVVICTPGPDTALTIRNAMAGGRTAGISTAAGVAMGQCVWTATAGVGLAGLLRASAPAFLAVRAAGAVYLVFLGVQSLRAARARKGEDSAPVRSGLVIRPARGMRQGLLNNLGNPKMAGFFLSLLPQFVGTGHDSLVAFLGYGLVFCLLTFGWLTGYSLVVSRARTLLGRPQVRRSLDALTGCVLIGLGFRVAAEQL